MNLILSTCGTSILTNNADAEVRSLVNRSANAKGETLEPSDLQQLKTHIAERKKVLLATSPQEAKKLSAELNGIISYYNGQLEPHQSDLHYLIISDTFLGQQVGGMIQDWLLQHQLRVQLQRVSGLVTNDLLSFHSAMASLIKWCEEVLTGWRESGYKIVFNLTGGFKSAQGFMQTIGMFYADESIYIFETGSLLRIPRLPIRLATEQIIRDNHREFRLLGQGESLSASQTIGIPETLLFEVDGEVTFSEWGELIWQRGKRQLFATELLEPLPGLSYSQPFRKDIEKQNLTQDYLATLNERLDQLSLVVQGKGANNKGLDFKKLTGDPKPPSTHECDVWSGDERRLFGHFENSTFVIDALARGLH
jgi:putative CRISPR-associated protein (TIGR02619 family)